MRRVLVSLLLAAAAVAAAPPASGHAGVHVDLERLTRAIEVEPDRADLRVERAFHSRLAGHFEAALADLDRAQTLQPGLRMTGLERGLTLAAMGKDTEAEAALTSFLASGPGHALALAQRARLRERAGATQAALGDYAASLALRPDVELYLARGALQERVGDRSGAAAGYRDGLERTGGAVVLRGALVRIETERGRYDAALALVDEELARSQVKTEGLLQRADILEAAGRPGPARDARLQALEEADRVLEQRSTAIHLVARARALLALGQRGEAERDLRQALDKSPRFLQARQMLERMTP